MASSQFSGVIEKGEALTTGATRTVALPAGADGGRGGTRCHSSGGCARLGRVSATVAARKRSGPPKRAAPTVPVKPATLSVAGLLPRRKGIYHAGCTGYPNPTYP